MGETKREGKGIRGGRVRVLFCCGDCYVTKGIKDIFMYILQRREICFKSINKTMLIIINLLL